MSDDGEVALWQQASSDLLALVVDAQLTEMLGYRLDRELALEALAARGGAGRPDVPAPVAGDGGGPARRGRLGGDRPDRRAPAGRRPPGGARREYELVLDRQKALGLVDANRTDPGPPDR